MEVINDRHAAILELLDSQGKVNVNALAERFDVAKATIRRDLTVLEASGKLHRIHGGATKISFYAEEPAIEERRDIYFNEKVKIAKLASGLVEDQMSIFIDVGTTTAQLVRFLRDKRRLQIFTNSIEAMMEMIQLVNKGILHAKIIFIGGEINAKQYTVSGSFSEDFVDRFFVDVAFIGVGGIHPKGGITGYEDREVMLSRKIIKNAKVAAALLDRSKIGVKNLYKIADLADLDVVLSDEKHPEDWSELLDNMNVTWMY